MHKISNFTGQARHGWERMTPTFGMSRPHQDMAAPAMRRPVGPPPPQSQSRPPSASSAAAAAAAAGIGSPPGLDARINLSFNVPFSSNLAGPDPEDIMHSTPGAFERWVFPDGTPEGTPTHKLPVHASHVEALRRLCTQMEEQGGDRIEAATVTSSEMKPVASLQRRPPGLVTNVCISGDYDAVMKTKARVLKETPIALRSVHVDVDVELVVNPSTSLVATSVLEHLDKLAQYTGTDIFLLSPKILDADSATISSYGFAGDSGLDHRFRVVIYGDVESAEHAKTRVLIMIDQILKRNVDAMKLELTMHTLVCGRTRKNIKLIEAETDTAIYFPPPFPRVFGYTPPGAHRRSEDEVFITGTSREQIAKAKQKLHDLVLHIKIFVKDAGLLPEKIDSILLDRLDKVRKVMETNGSYVLFPQLGSRCSAVRVQGTDVLHVERTVREIMALAGQFYSASWSVITDSPNMRGPSSVETRVMLSDICTNSGAEVSFDKSEFRIAGSDEAVKAAMMVIHQIPFVKRSTYKMRVKIELANEHKEFVSGKKNGKINKIMGQSNVQIIFDGFNEYNFSIDVCGSQYEATKNGLDLVEQEMPASISFHVPDQYHKRIIGIGGQHIQRIMKKYSVFVKFSNAMDRGGLGKDDEDDIKVDNVICRTPARNAQSLDLVKQEIMDMVEKADAEYVSETVAINRLYHRQLIKRVKEIEELEKRWNCKIDFPSTELASDAVTISGPEYQVTQAVDAFLRMVPMSHELSFQSSAELRAFFDSPDFVSDVQAILKNQYEVDATVESAHTGSAMSSPSSEGETQPDDRIVLRYTRNNSGGLKDAIDFLITRLVAHGLDATTVKGAIQRPKSDSFENSLPFFDSKLLQHAPPPIVTDSPIRTSFGDDVPSERGSLFERLRRPGSISSFSSFIGRKNPSSSGSIFRHASSNASRASLVSMESRDSSYRNPWNDSGINLPEDDLMMAPPAATVSTNGGWPARFDIKFPFASSTSGTGRFAGAAGLGMGLRGDRTPKHDMNGSLRASFDSGGRPGTASSAASGYPAPIGPPR